jgi:hypothetical protein
MNAVATVTPARALLDLVHPGHGAPTPTDAAADNAMLNFVADLAALDRVHNRNKKKSQDQLAEQLFRRSPVANDLKSAKPYLRYNLRAAFEELKTLDTEMRSRCGGAITVAELHRFRHIISDYLFDLREILEVLQQRVAGWEFFGGGKNAGVDSWEVFMLARNLAFQSALPDPRKAFDHKTAQIASIFVLRQAMELRFERLIAVYPTDPKGRPPRLRHGFHHAFVAGNPQHFKANGFEVKKLQHLYDWCSEIVHQAYQPYAWQVSMALRRAGDLLHTRAADSGQPWSIHNAVEITDVGAMQTAYENHFLATYGHGMWRMTRRKPEALVRDWLPDMAFTGTEYRPVVNRPGLCRRIRIRLRGLLRKLG